MRARVLAATLAGCATMLIAAAAQADDAAQPRPGLRVCADPSNLPFSNQAEEGFENRIAALLGERLGLPLVYTWWPNTIGFFRNTLRAKKCDLVMGVVEGFELAATTKPYYRSTYVMVYRTHGGLSISGLDDPGLRGATIGAVANTPPVDLLVKYDLLSRLRSYGLVVDTRVEHPARQMIEDVANDDIDVALVWGPIGGYYARRQSPPLTVVTLAGEPDLAPLEFSISAAVRHGEPEWQRQLDTLLIAHRAEIDAILIDYGVPLRDLSAAEPK